MIGSSPFIFIQRSGNAKRFAEEMNARGIVENVGAEAGNESYASSFSMNAPEPYD